MNVIQSHDVFNLPRIQLNDVWLSFLFASGYHFSKDLPKDQVQSAEFFSLPPVASGYANLDLQRLFDAAEK